MKIITLNVWGGKIREPLVEFLQKYGTDTDIFCFQEVFHNAKEKIVEKKEWFHPDLHAEMETLLPDHAAYFCPIIEDYFGITIFVKKDLEVHASGDIVIYENPLYEKMGKKDGNHSRKMFWLEISGERLGKKTISVMNVHGLWNGKGKTDTPERIEQSKRIRDFMDSKKIPQIVCGDFNLLPDTKSIALLEKGMRNLVKDFNIKSTRTSFYTRTETSGSFADYIFTSPDIEVIDFKVLPEEVSDHAALFMEFRVKS